MKTIIYAHPYDGSLNHSILEGIIEKFTDNSVEYQIINLYADKFNPVLTSDELYKYFHGNTDDILVKKYQSMLKQTDDLIMIFPTWWYDMPAILKGFFDKVMVPKVIYNTDDAGMMLGKLTNIKKATIITTAGQTESYFKKNNINSLSTTFIDQILPDLGLKKGTITRLHFGTLHQTKEDSSSFLIKAIKAV